MHILYLKSRIGHLYNLGVSLPNTGHLPGPEAIFVLLPSGRRPPLLPFGIDIPYLPYAGNFNPGKCRELIYAFKARKYFQRDLLW